jgi:two-component system, NarL family, nitrate/nitrite response regulator NarL
LERTSIFLCESQPIVVEGFQRVLASEPDLWFCGARQAFPEALEAIREIQPGVVLMDRTPGLKIAMQFVSDVKTVSPNSRPLLWVQELAEAECFRVLQLGVRGVIKRSMPVSSLLECVRAVAAGEVWVESSLASQVQTALTRHGSSRLTPRERDIVRCVCAGLKNKEIACDLAITAGTVKVHLMHIFEKTGVKDRFELALHGRKLIADGEVQAHAGD